MLIVRDILAAARDSFSADDVGALRLTARGLGDFLVGGKSHGGEFEEYNPMGYFAMQSGRSRPTFQRCVLPL
jgi:hypothetical protein